ICCWSWPWSSWLSALFRVVTPYSSAFGRAVMGMAVEDKRRAVAIDGLLQFQAFLHAFLNKILIGLFPPRLQDKEKVVPVNAGHNADRPRPRSARLRAPGLRF